MMALTYKEAQRASMWKDVTPAIAPDSSISEERQDLQWDPDGIRWIVYTQQTWEAGKVRLPHWTAEDNYPNGHFVGWSSPPMWWLYGMAYTRHLITGESMPIAISGAAPYYHLTIWLLIALLAGGLAVRAYGVKGALIIPLLYATLFKQKYGIYYTDHHVWVLLAAIGMLICLTAPFYKARGTNEKWWFIGAGVFSAFGMWISAPTHALIIISLFTGMLFIPAEAARNTSAKNWRYYGYTGGILSLLAYLWEFYPNLPLRVELNNHAYAAGLFVAGFWFEQAQQFAAANRQKHSISIRTLLYSGLALLLALAPLVMNYPQCFSLADPYFSHWESQIVEEQPISFKDFMFLYPLLCIALGASLWNICCTWKQSHQGFKSVIIFISAVALLYGYFGFSNFRFMEIVFVALCFLIVMSMPNQFGEKSAWLVAVISGLICLSALHESSSLTKSVKIFGFKMTSLANAYDCRGISEQLLLLDPTGTKSVLAPAYEANLINYYTEMPVYGTAYWENKDGLLITNRIYYYEYPGNTPDWEPVYNLLKENKVDYIYIPKQFSYEGSYVLYGLKRIENPQYSFANYLLTVSKANLPPWLEMENNTTNYRIFSVIH
ncbi:MAG: hypothetical protein JW739_01495 [Opitutales bacterium]|nr:hypothetical protein [Opitutales bacterium]